MGEAYKARDTRLDRVVAIKISHEQFSELFEREARAVAALSHPNICTLHDLGPNYLVMEYIEGAPLLSKEKPGSLPLDQALRYASQICDALDAAHQKGITHRDLKPANILVTKSGIKPLDFGLAKFSPAKPMNDATLTMALTGKDEIVGTLYYMSPEQLQEQATGKEVDTRSDIFSLGLVLYEMLTSKRAFDGPSPASVIAGIMERPAPSIGAVAPPALERLLQRCLKKDPGERWQTARDLKAELEWITTTPSGDSGTAAAASLPVRPGSANPPSATWAWLSAALFLIAAITVATIHFTERPAPRPGVRFTMLPPDGGSFPGTTPRMAISPDGTQLAFQFPGSQGRQQTCHARIRERRFAHAGDQTGVRRDVSSLATLPARWTALPVLRHIHEFGAGRRVSRFAGRMQPKRILTTRYMADYASGYPGMNPQYVLASRSRPMFFGRSGSCSSDRYRRSSS